MGTWKADAPARLLTAAPNSGSVVEALRCKGTTFQLDQKPAEQAQVRAQHRRKNQVRCSIVSSTGTVDTGVLYLGMLSVLLLPLDVSRVNRKGVEL